MQSNKITSEQIKAARHAISLSNHEIAQATGIGIATLRRYEASQGVPKSRKGHLKLLKSFFEARGIEFVGAPDEGPGIRIWNRGD
jgi:DNA-binding transcriptional regulator YiaG